MSIARPRYHLPLPSKGRDWPEVHKADLVHNNTSYLVQQKQREPNRSELWEPWSEEKMPACSLRESVCKVGKIMASESVPIGQLSKKRKIHEVVSGGQWPTFGIIPDCF